MTPVILLLFATVLMGCGTESGTAPRRGDTVPPGAVLDLSGERSIDDSLTLHWTAPGDDGYAGRAQYYEMRYDSVSIAETNWSNAISLSGLANPRSSGLKDSVRIGGLGQRDWHFALRAADEERNWSDLSNSALVGRDTIPPSAIVDLSIPKFDETSISLAWTAPGDDAFAGRAAAYDLRYSDGPIDDSAWETATLVPELPGPSQPGVEEQFVVSKLTTRRTYYFALRTIDESGNRSLLSNLVLATTSPDTIPPGRVTDLETTFAAGHNVRLRWTAPGNNGVEGRAASYDLRYSPFPISQSDWEHATRVLDLPAPRSSGEAESWSVQGLTLDTEHHFVLRTRDHAGNWSDLSNEIVTTTVSFVMLTQNSRVPGASGASWDPNGESIVFGNWGDRFQLHQMSFVGGNSVQLTDHEGGVANPRWSSDGGLISCTVYRTVGLETHEALGVTQPRPGAAVRAVALYGANRGVSGSAWSPDSRRIAYELTLTDSPTLEGQILVVDADGGVPEILFSDGSRIRGLDWSPDGGMIVFSSNRNGNYDLFTLPLTGGEPIPLMHGPTDEVAPAFSPDGSLLVFSSTEAGSPDLWVMPSTGGSATQVTFSADRESSTTWSPSGDALCFTLSRNGIRDVAILYLPQTLGASNE